VARGHQHTGLQLFLAKGVGRFADGALVVAQLVHEEKRVLPVELGFHGVVSEKEGEAMFAV
jgi:hypothetical protein